MIRAATRTKSTGPPIARCQKKKEEEKNRCAECVGVGVGVRVRATAEHTPSCLNLKSEMAPVIKSAATTVTADPKETISKTAKITKFICKSESES